MPQVDRLLVMMPSPAAEQPPALERELVRGGEAPLLASSAGFLRLVSLLCKNERIRQGNE
jgi:hypothetical protein